MTDLPHLPEKKVTFEILGHRPPGPFSTGDSDHKRDIALNLWRLTHGGRSGRVVFSPGRFFRFVDAGRFEDEAELRILLEEHHSCDTSDVRDDAGHNIEVVRSASDVRKE